MPFAGPLTECADYAMVRRLEKRPVADLWPIRLRDPLPVPSIPPRESDPDVPPDLRAALDRVYDAAHYGNYFYEGTPYPALDVDWAKRVSSGHNRTVI